MEATMGNPIPDQVEELASPFANDAMPPLIIDVKTAGLIGIANKPGGFTGHDTRMASAFKIQRILDADRADTEIFGWRRKDMNGRSAEILHVDAASRQAFLAMPRRAMPALTGLARTVA